MPAASRPHHQCPSCRARLRQVHRRLEDHDSPLGDELRRYRCRNADCGWEGLLARAHRRRPRSSRRSRRTAGTAPAAAMRRSRITTALLLMLSAAIAAAIVALHDRSVQTGDDDQTTMGVAAPSALMTAPLK